MNSRRTPNHRAERGFTLPELMISIGISSVVLMATFSFMGMTQKGWKQGSTRADMTDEMAITTSQLVRSIHSTKIDSIKIATGAKGDTLKIGGGIRFYRTAGNDLVYKTPTNTKILLDSLVTAFTSKKPYVRGVGDTLKNAVFLTLKLRKDDATDSTSLILVPRIQ